jgi:hypothetical protein
VSESFDPEEECDVSESERRDDVPRGDAVEEAGETTAADTIKGPDDQSPVGEDTEVEVEEKQ